MPCIILSMISSGCVIGIILMFILGEKCGYLNNQSNVFDTIGVMLLTFAAIAAPLSEVSWIIYILCH